jgi:hypothetical protein
MLEEPATIPFTFLADAVIAVRVRVDDREPCAFLLDSGAGLDIVARSLADDLALETRGTFSGKRMTGEVLTLPLGSVASLALDEFARSRVVVGVTEIFDRLPDALGAIHGALSLKFFEKQPFSIDYANTQIILESDASLRERERAGTSVAVECDRDGETTLGMMIEVEFAPGKTGRFEVDTGNSTTILDAGVMAELGVDPESADVRSTAVDGGVRHYASHPRVALAAAPAIVRAPAPVCFEPIIYDGVIGNDFLGAFVVTFDVPRSRMIFAPAQPHAATAESPLRDRD